MFSGELLLRPVMRAVVQGAKRGAAEAPDANAAKRAKGEQASGQAIVID